MKIFKLIRLSNILTRKSNASKHLRIFNLTFRTTYSAQSSKRIQPKRFILYGLCVGSVGLAAGYGHKLYNIKNNDESHLSDLKLYSREEVAKHNSLEKGVWITYKGLVYDITDFIEHHPGGSHTILMGAGGDVEPFWQTYTVHFAQEVQNLLAKYQIGALQLEEKPVSHSNDPLSISGPYACDPQRHHSLTVLSKEPFNAETPPDLLVSNHLTPNDIFFVRNHLPVPEVDVKEYNLVICTGTDAEPENQKEIASFTLDELKSRFKPHTITSVVQCSGNRRSELKQIKEIKGLDWGVGAIGNASWTGVKLVDLLESSGIKPSESIRHIQLEGLDCDMSGQSYASSISADVAFESNRDVLLAYEMNGEPLSRDHGFPLRFIAPGITGARNVKWLSKLILSHEESNSHWQRRDYKSFSPSIDMFNLNYDTSVSIQEMPVQSSICSPLNGASLKVSSKSLESDSLSIPVNGYAYSGGGKMIVRVDISVDGGSSWLTAKLLDQPQNVDGYPDFTNRNRFWSWMRWSLDVPIPEEIIKNKGGQIEILTRAFDSAYNTQPERPETVWNVRGVVNNSWHKIKLQIDLI